MSASTDARVAVVTGAAGGIGKAIARDLANHGWSLVLVDVNEREARTAEAELGILTAVAIVVADVSDRYTHVLAADAAEQLGTLAGWVNCAGITIREPLHAITSDIADRVIGVNQYGSLWGTSVAVDRMRGTGGAIVNMSSVHARASYADFAVYEMTKAAIEALTRNAAIAYGSQGIRANAVAPGAIMTPALAASFESAPDADGARSDLAERSALGRIGEAREIASVVTFLLSGAASYVTGQSIVIDGGWTSMLGRDSADPSRRRTAGGSE